MPVYNEFSVPIYINKMYGHEDFKSHFVDYVSNPDNLHLAWDSRTPTTHHAPDPPTENAVLAWGGERLKEYIDWKPFTKEVANHHIHMYFKEAFGQNISLNWAFDSWINKYRKGDYQEQHNHLNSTTQLSLAYMVSTPTQNNRNGIRFVEPKNDFWTFCGLTDHVGGMPRRVYNPPQEEGTLIIFPSYLDHYVIRHDSDVPRITVSSNLHVFRNL